MSDCLHYSILLLLDFFLSIFKIEIPGSQSIFMTISMNDFVFSVCASTPDNSNTKFDHLFSGKMLVKFQY